MSSMKSILVNMIFLGILIFAIMSFIVIIQKDNSVDPVDRITNNSLINDSIGDLETSLNKQDDAQRALNESEKDIPQEYAGDLDVSSIISSTLLARTMTITIWNIIIKLPQVILGVSSIVASAITVVLIILIIIGFWAWKKGAVS